MGHTVLAFFFLALYCVPGLCQVNLVATKNLVAVGSNVNITVNGSISITVGLWLFGPNTMYMWFPGDIMPGNSLPQGVDFDPSTYQLTLSSVALNSSGLYVLDSYKPNRTRLQIALDVQEPVSNVTVAVSATNLVELNDSVTFTCSAGGSPLWFSWQNGNSVVTSGERVQIGNGGRDLVINSVMRYDVGPFKCVVANNISSQQSVEVNLNISYGPSNLTMTVSPDKTVYISGSAISLSCSADSKPAASFNWMFNGNPLNVSGPSYELKNTTQNQSGQYTCIAQNAITLRYVAMTKTIRVVDPISAVVVNPAGAPIEEKSFNVSCNVVGPVDSIQWMKNGVYLYNDNTTTFSSDNSTLSFKQLTLSDDGHYQCAASNAVSNMTSQAYNLTVNYGPINTVALGPDIAEVGTSVTFSCSSVSRPTSQYSWFFNGSKVSEGPVYATAALLKNQTGLYTCIAFNTITGKSNNDSVTLTVLVPVSNVMVNMDNGQQPIFSHSYTLTCSASGDVEHIQWMKNGTVLYPHDAITFSSDNSTLTFNNLTLSDDGHYQCKASNAVSNMTSTAYELMVNYGPWNITANGPSIAKAESNVTFSCSAVSRPASHFSWFFNSLWVGDGPVYVTEAVSHNSSGQYTCIASNTITGINGSASVQLTVVVPVSNVFVNAGNQQPIFSHSYTLTCSASGDVEQIQWMKNGTVLYPHDAITFSSDNSTLSFNNLTLSDDGHYQCKASNAVSNMTSTAYDLMVNYGPWNITANGPNMVKAGSNVTFSCSAVSRPASHFSWFFNSSWVGDGPVYVTEAVSRNSSGQYTCIASNTITGINGSASVQLTVIVPVSNVFVNAGNQQPIFSHSYTLTCSASGDVEQIQWMKNSTVLYPHDAITFSSDNSTLTFNNLILSDDGHYQCKASNAVSNMTSSAYDLMVNYGPWNITVNGPSIAKAGSNVTFSCAAVSRPASQFSWFFNSLWVGDGPVYVTEAVSRNSSGQYTCIASNTITGINSSASVQLTVIDPVSNVVVNAGNQQPIFNNSFTLTCSASGDVEHIQWLKNSMVLYPHDAITFSSDNSTLSFNNLTLSDDGHYQCKASNSVSNMTSTAYDLMVNYGPWNITVNGPSKGETGTNVTFSCTAASHPTSQFSWFFNGSRVGDGPVFVTEPLSHNSSGQYTCMASNAITGISSSASVQLTVIDAITTVDVTANRLIPLASQSLQLTCNVKGPYLSLHWIKNNKTIMSSDRITFSADNTTLTFSSLQTADDGTYQCVASNEIRHHVSHPYELVVIFGPQSVQIIVHPSIPPVLTCQAVSQPPAVYHWILENNTVVGNQSSIVLPIQYILGSNYTCVAKNPLTNVTVYTSQVVSYPDAAISVQASVVLTALLVLLFPVLEEWL